MLSVVVPTYNERENITELIKRIESALKGTKFEVIIVDDGSPDGTAEAAEELNKLYGNIRVHRRHGKMGLASAIMDGIELASSKIVAVIDADLQHPPEALLEMLRRIMEGNDLVVASRYVEGGGIEGWGRGRRLISKVARELAHLLLPETRKVKDVMSGYFMLRRDILLGVKLDLKGYKILLEILLKAKYRSVVEVPYTFKPRIRGESKLRFKEILNYLHLLLRLAMKGGS
jgi:dolichol-phosphate mannosyltransferase